MEPAERAFLNSVRFVTNPRDTNVLVSVVPIFAPITTGIALGKLKKPEDTTATIIVVTVELLCIRAVLNKPMNKPIKGLEVAKSIDCAVSPPIIVSDPATISIEQRNSIIENTNHNREPDHFFGPLGSTLLPAMLIILDILSDQ
jgi:hypothetical protein